MFSAVSDMRPGINHSVRLYTEYVCLYSVCIYSSMTDKTHQTEIDMLSRQTPAHR